MRVRALLPAVFGGLAAGGCGVVAITQWRKRQQEQTDFWEDFLGRVHFYGGLYGKHPSPRLPQTFEVSTGGYTCFCTLTRPGEGVGIDNLRICVIGPSDALHLLERRMKRNITFWLPQLDCLPDGGEELCFDVLIDPLDIPTPAP